MNNKSKYTEEQIIWLKNHYKIKTIQECMSKLGCSRQALSSLLHKNRITKKQFFNYGDSFNVDLENPILIYLLGFIWADGHLRKNGNKYVFSMTIQERDGLNLKPLFESLGQFNVRKTSFKDKQDTITFLSINQPFCLFLLKNDYINKSKLEPSKILKIIPSKLIRYWWRGFYEGDGSLTLCKSGKFLAISGPYQYEWMETKSYMNLLGLKPFIKNKITKWGKNSSCNLYNQDSILKFTALIYDNRNFDKIGLYRKYKKFIEFLKYRIRIKSKSSSKKECYYSLRKLMCLGQPL